MEENASDSDSDQYEPGEAEMALVGVEESVDGLFVMRVGEAGEDSSDQHEGEDDEEEQQFDITLPATHSYLGSELEQLGGRQVLEAGWTGRVPGISHHGTVFPGETVPMLLPQELRATVLQDRLFCLLWPDEAGGLSSLSVLCEVLAGAGESAAAGIVARAAHRVRLRPRARQHEPRRTHMVEVVVLPEIAPGDPLLPSRLPSLDALRRVDEKTLLHPTLQRMDAANTPWPAFVWRLLDYRRLRGRLHAHFATLGLEDKMPVDPVSLSFWVASNLALSPRDRLALFSVDNALLRLSLALRCVDRSMAMCCGTCGEELARREQIFAMSSDGVHGNYTNYGGFMHDIVTVRMAHDISLGPPSAEYSWFPGYAWRVAQCARCGTHVGWRFDAVRKKLRPAQFFALCRNVVAPRADAAAAGDANDADAAPL